MGPPIKFSEASTEWGPPTEWGPGQSAPVAPLSATLVATRKGITRKGTTVVGHIPYLDEYLQFVSYYVFWDSQGLV